ncbi:MAG TPA: 5'/3'-nucleotidase SurE [Spirochaetota bacterium]|nr:5'/3'-nucleotidase SurE [Spirochaetota bacterium]
MRILLTNDDGINAEGIQSLNKKLSKRHEIYIIAPDRERSACSNIFTMRDEIKIIKTTDNTYSINGYPADCVSLGLHSGLIPEVDLVVSGINHGPNLGDDVHFSGTVAGARTAVIFGKPGIAISANTQHRPSVYFDQMSDFLLDFLEKDFPLKGEYLNINYPDLPGEQVMGTMYTFLSKRLYIDSYRVREQISESEFTMLLEGKIETRHETNSDSDALNRGFISITPLTINTTDYSSLPDIKKN